jgi:hypothetical protein
MTTSKQRNGELEPLFDERIIQNRNICDNCFTKIREVLREFDDVDLPKSLRGCLDNITARVDAETVYYPSYSVSEGIVIACSKCETQEYIEREVRNLESGESMEKTRELEGRLREDEDVSLQGDLRKAVKERFHAPKYQFKDQLKMFSDAVGEVAVRSGGLQDQ